MGIPYMWSKRKIAKEIVEHIKKENPKAKYFYDIFWGWWSIAFEAIRQGFSKVYYVDLDRWMCNLMEKIKTSIPTDWYWRLDREEFHKIKDREDAYSVAMSICWSFGHDRSSYAYSRELEGWKKALHYAVVDQDYSLLENFWIFIKLKWTTIEERRLETRKAISIDQMRVIADNLGKKSKKISKKTLQEMKAVENIVRLQQLERLHKLERVYNTESLQQLKILCCGYDQISIETPLEETVLYLDPPYRGTKWYKVSKNGFDYKKLDRWFRSLPCNSYMSEEIPHNIELTIPKIRTMQWGSGAKILEVLYSNAMQ